jgi:hypothetical protein
MYFGVNYSGEQTDRYVALLGQLYPAFYELEENKTVLRHWKTRRAPGKALNDTLRILYYAAARDFDIGNLRIGAWAPDSVFAAYRQPVSGESAYLVSFRQKPE